jgi:hypothetical protein
MPVELLSESERAKLSRFPSEIPREDLIGRFSLREENLDLIDTLQGGDASQLGFALQIAALRYLGFVPSGLTEASKEAKRFLADQIGADPDALKRYGERPKTKREHQVKAMEHVSFRRATSQDLGRVGDWLTERALEHDRPAVLMEATCEKLRRKQEEEQTCQAGCLNRMTGAVVAKEHPLHAGGRSPDELGRRALRG